MARGLEEKQQEESDIDLLVTLKVFCYKLRIGKNCQIEPMSLRREAAFNNTE